MYTPGLSTIVHLGIITLGAVTKMKKFLLILLFLFAARPVQAAEPNLISNPSLETASYRLPVGWETGVWGENKTVFSYPVPGYQSLKAARLDVRSYVSGDAKWYFKEVAVNEGTIYDFSNYYKSNILSHVVVRYTDNAGSQSYVYLAQVNPAKNWKKTQVSFTVPAGIKTLTIFHLLNQNGYLVTDNYLLTARPAGETFTRGRVSLAFDDGWRSTLENGLPILNAAGLKSTQFVITGYLTGDQNYVSGAEVLQMFAAGHEIGSHTRTHPHLPTLTDGQKREEIIGSFDDLTNLGIAPVVSFAYPYGEYDAQTIAIIKETGYQNARTAVVADSGFNTKNSDPWLLKTQSVEATTTLDQVKSWIDTANNNKTWLILVFHQIDNSGTQYATSPARLQEIVDYLTQTNTLVVPIKDGLKS
jgi:peptidoglycan/xylan/chitin deacetylase (PgdA/CDA1 family)